MPRLVNFRYNGTYETPTLDLVFDHDCHPDIPVGAVLRLSPVVDEHGALFAYFIIDDATGEALHLVAAECVRVVGT